METAWRLAGERGLAAVTLAEVSRAAGISRQGLYLQVGSRTGLLIAMTRHHDEQAGLFDRIADALNLDDPQASLTTLMRCWCSYLPQIQAVTRELAAAAVTETEAADAWNDRMRELRRAFVLPMRRLDRDGRLSAGWTPRRAADWAWHAVHPDAWQHLVVDCGWSAREFSDRSIATVLSTLVAPAAEHRPNRRRLDPAVRQ